ncbi:hypothetical protein VTK56DRAFT_6910 [Thermocarpiscus australiensis]
MKTRRKTTSSAIFARSGIYGDVKIHRGNPKIRRSVPMLKTAVKIIKTRRLMQRLPLIAGSQLNGIGRHCRVMAKKPATVCETSVTLNQNRDLRIQSFWPNRRDRKIRTDDLTSASIGPYSICTAYDHINRSVGSLSGTWSVGMPTNFVLITVAG